MRVPLALYGAVLFIVCVVPILSAQDATKVDSAHYTVVSDNAQVRILKVHYGPHEKSVMHSHPAGVVVYLTDANTKFTYPSGKSETVTGKAGDARYTPATVHLPENLADTPMDAIVIELKGRTSKPMKSATK